MKNRATIIILLILGLCFVFNSVVLKKLYPDADIDYYVWVEYDATRHLIYEIMFALFFLETFLLSGRFLKATACFFMILSASSVVDKAIYNVTDYLVSDIILVIVSLIVSAYIYVREVRK